MKIKDLLSDESKWTKGANARMEPTRNSIPVAPEGPDAVCWCLLGAAAKCYIGQPIALQDSLAKIKEGINRPGGINDAIADWNDRPCRTFAQIQELVTRLDV